MRDLVCPPLDAFAANGLYFAKKLAGFVTFVQVERHDGMCGRVDGNLFEDG